MPTPSKWGSEFVVNSLTTGDQHEPTIAALADGRFVVVWTDENSPLGDGDGAAVVGQIYNADGSTFGGEFLVNKSVKAGDQSEPAVTALDGGGFMVAWESINDSGTGIRGRTFHADGSAAGSEFKIGALNGVTAFSETEMTTLADGRVVVGWTVVIGNGPNEGFRVQIVNPDGSASGPLIEYASTTALNADPRFTALQDGRFVVAWDYRAQQGSKLDCHAQIYNADGSKSGAEFIVNTTTADDQNNVSLATLSDGRFVATWESVANTVVHVYAQIFNANGSKAGGEFLISNSSELDNANVTAIDGGGFIATFRSYGVNDNIYGQAFDANGSKIGAEFQVNTTISGVQGTDGAVIATLADGRIVIAFTDGSHSAGDTSGAAIRAQIFDPRDGGIAFFGTDLNDQRVGTDHVDILSGGNGDDILQGAGDNDSLTGGAGDDELSGGAGNDAINGGAGADRLDGGTGIDTATYISSNQGVTVNLLSTGGKGGDAEGDQLISIEKVIGSNFHDALTGNSAANVLEGRGGADTIYGGTNNDVLIGGASGDDLDGGSGSDTASYASSGGVTVNLATGIGSGGDAAGDHLTSVENLIGGDFADTLIGDGGVNKIEGGKGSDTLDGNGGSDTLAGGIGNDTYIAHGAGESIFEKAGEGTDQVNSDSTFALAAGSNLENLLLLDLANINGTGNELANVITGNAGLNTLDGKGGADTMRGMGGNDNYIIDNPGDIVDESIAGSGGGDGVWSSTISVNLSDTLHFKGDIESIALLGSANLNATGNGLNNFLLGNSGNNQLNGGSGADNMRGMGGNDNYIVDIDDVVDESVAGSGGGDAVYSSTISINLADALHFKGDIESIGLTGSTNLNATGNGLSNTLVGNTGANVLDGGLGADTLIGGAGNDVFRFDTALGSGNVDTITDYSVVNDQIQIDNAVFAGLVNGSLTASAFYAGLAAHDADDRIIYNSATGALFFDSDGTGATAQIQFATLSAGLAMAAGEFTVI